MYDLATSRANYTGYLCQPINRSSQLLSSLKHGFVLQKFNAVILTVIKYRHKFKRPDNHLAEIITREMNEYKIQLQSPLYLQLTL